MSTPAAPSTRKGADGYLASLLSYSLETLDREPSVLDSQEEALQQELQDTATRNYQGFIEAASCFHQIRGQVQDVKAQLKGLGESLQGLHSQTTEFAATAQEYQVRKLLMYELTTRTVSDYLLRDMSVRVVSSYINTSVCSAR